MGLATRVVIINGLLFAVGTAVLAFSPATVSRSPAWSELVVLVLGLGAILVANTWLVRRSMREVNEVLATRENAQREASLAALAAQESERARIARELHDGVGQSLTAVLLEAGALAAKDDHLTGIREGVRASLEEVRRVASSLRPSVLEDLGLHSALRSLVTELFDNIDTHAERAIAPGVPELDAATELVLFRVAQEALTNVARHARAANVQLGLGTLGTDVELWVIDDGVGIAPDAVGTGISGMRERAELVGGRMSIARRDGGGTAVRLRVPVRP